MNKTNLDLDALVENKSEIKLNGKVYKTGDLPVSIVLMAEKLLNNPEPSDLVEVAYKLLSIKNKITKEEIENMSLNQLQHFIQWSFDSVKKNDEQKIEVAKSA